MAHISIGIAVWQVAEMQETETESDGLIAPVGEATTLCFQCAKCTGLCPVALRRGDFNPRRIVLALLRGNYDELISKESVIWLCASCFSCDEYCPQDVKPHGVIRFLRNLAAAKGELPDNVRKVVERIERDGVSTHIARSLNKRREALGLDEFSLHGAVISRLFEE